MTCALRARLLEKLSAVKAYFEATSINLNLRSPYWGAFDALRRNQPLAESFVNDLQGLLQFLDNDLAPILTALQSGAAPSAAAAPPATSGWRSAEPPSSSINDDQTRLLPDRAIEPRRELPGARSSGRGLAAPIIDMDARPRPSRSRRPSRGAEMRAALLPEFDVETSPIELLPEPVTSRAAPAVRGGGGGQARQPEQRAPVRSSERGRKTAATAGAAGPEPSRASALAARGCSGRRGHAETPGPA